MTSPLGPVCPAAAVPMAPKMPAPITAPMASMMRSPAPNTRFRACGPVESGCNSAIGFRANSCDMRWELDHEDHEVFRHRDTEVTENLCSVFSVPRWQKEHDQSNRYAVSFDATTSSPLGPNATPTSVAPATTGVNVPSA